MINTVIFDLDGTLLNSLDDICDSINETLIKYGYPTRTLEEVKSFVGNGALALVKKALPNTIDSNKQAHTINDFLKSYQDHYKNNLQNKTKPYDGIDNLLKELSNKGYKLAVVSNKSDDGVKALCKDYFNTYIKTAIGESIHTPKKPAKEGVLQALKELNSSLEEAIYVGDSEVDVLTAHNANLPCVGVTWGFRSKEVLLQYDATYIIDEPSELIKILNGLS
jgi:phosphoglycolate phosphatase